MVALLTSPMSGMAAQPHLAADLAVGVSGGSGPRDKSSGFTLDATVILHSARPALGRFVAIALAAEGAAPRGDVCRMDGAGGCRDYPTFKSISALAGADVTRRWLSVGAAVGPTVVVSSDYITAGGLQARLQLATPGMSRVAFAVTGRRSSLPNYRGAGYSMSAVTIGMRVRQRGASR